MLKYLFDVEYTDGTTYTQNAEDKSILLPNERSCFYDVMQAIEGGKSIRWFMLSDGIDSYAVNLEHGYFDVNCKAFYMHEEGTLSDFRIIFFRQHTHNFNVGVDANEEVSHEVVYRFGWQCLDQDGKNVQRVMEFH